MMTEQQKHNALVNGLKPEFALCANCEDFETGNCPLNSECKPQQDEFGYCSYYVGDGIAPEYPNTRKPPQFLLQELDYLEKVVENQFWDDEDKEHILAKIKDLQGWHKESEVRK